MKLRLGIDMDGVLIDVTPIWREYYNANATSHGHAGAYDIPTYWGYSEQVCQQCLDYCMSSRELLLQTPLMPGARESLQALQERADFFLVSHRDTVLGDCATELLKMHGVHDLFIERHWISSSKRSMCEELQLQALVDDAPYNIEEVAESDTVVPVIFDHPYNRHLSGVRVRSWQELADWVGDEAVSGLAG